MVSFLFLNYFMKKINKFKYSSAKYNSKKLYCFFPSVLFSAMQCRMITNHVLTDSHYTPESEISWFTLDFDMCKVNMENILALLVFFVCFFFFHEKHS